MRISPNHPRLRLVALACWTLSALCFLYGGELVTAAPYVAMLNLSTNLLATLALALGIPFWMLGTDRRAGVIFDTKGLLLNLGHSSSFVAWDNIERVGVSRYRSHVLSLGSVKHVGIALKDIQPYVQSYESRLPASQGILATAMRALASTLRPLSPSDDKQLRSQLEQNRAHTGFDLLIPEAFLGGRADSFAELADSYRRRSLAHRIGGIVWAP